MLAQDQDARRRNSLSKQLNVQQSIQPGQEYSIDGEVYMLVQNRNRITERFKGFDVNYFIETNHGTPCPPDERARFLDKRNEFYLKLIDTIGRYWTENKRVHGDISPENILCMWNTDRSCYDLLAIDELDDPKTAYRSQGGSFKTGYNVRRIVRKQEWDKIRSALKAKSGIFKNPLPAEMYAALKTCWLVGNEATRGKLRKDEDPVSQSSEGAPDISKCFEASESDDGWDVVLTDDGAELVADLTCKALNSNSEASSASGTMHDEPEAKCGQHGVDSSNESELLLLERRQAFQQRPGDPGVRPAYIVQVSADGYALGDKVVTRVHAAEPVNVSIQTGNRHCGAFLENMQPGGSDGAKVSCPSPPVIPRAT